MQRSSHEIDDWTIEVHETRDRPTGAASTHHVSDVVLRAKKWNQTIRTS